MSSIAADFAEAVSTVSRPAGFFVAGTEQMLAPGLAVEGIGPVALPLLPVQAELLIAAAERAPYGRGEATLTDLTVRRTWQIAADRVRIGGKHWPDTLKAIVTRVTEGLGVTDPVEADLYKLLVYDQGSFFVPHRDTEKVPGMFATLVLALPSVCDGGALIVRHNDREAHLNLRCEDPSEVAFAAFYADCVHEVLPVTAGYRLVLVYNLVRHGSGRLPEAPNYDAEQDTVTTLLEQWARTPRSAEDAEPEKLIYPLEHAYTVAELDFGSLKGADAGIAQVVVAAARRAGCDVHLALISIEECGIAEYNGDYGRSRHGRYATYDEDDDEDEEDEFEVVEVCETHAVASAWRRLDGEPSPLIELPVEEDELSPPVSFEELEPDEQHFHEATGNEGASFERSYRRAALILWPSDRLLAVINQGGLDITLPFLTGIVDRWAARGEDHQSLLWQQADELSRDMASAWPVAHWYPRHDNEPTDVGRFLDQLLRLENTTRIEAFLIVLAGRHGFDIGDCTAIANALRILPPDRSARLARDLIEGAAEPALAACANLLARLSELDAVFATGAARTLVAALPGDPSHDAAPETWRRGPSVQPGFIVNLFTALSRIDATLAAVSADHVLDWPAVFDFDKVLVPAMHTLLELPETADLPAVRQVRDACVAHLDKRIAPPLEAPADWRRDDAVGCDCTDCRALGVFLDNATQEVWVFAAAERRRRHVESTIRNARFDVDTATERRGSPHRLISTKNQASHQRRCVQRAKDLADRDQLTL